MPNIRGLLHSKPKIDEEELGLAQSRAVARLADLTAQRRAPSVMTVPSDFRYEVPSAEDRPTTTGDFLDMLADRAEDNRHPGASDAPEPVAGAPRPPIIVEGVEANGVGPENGQVKHVDVMAPLREQMGKDNSQLHAADGLFEPPLEAELPAEIPPGLVKDDPESSAPVLAEGDSDVVDAGVDAPPVEDVGAIAQAPDDVGDTIQQTPVVDEVEPAAAVRPAPPNVRPRRSSSPQTSSRPSARPFQGTRTASMQTAAAPASTAFCPYCALVLEPAPVSSQRCSRCRQRIIVKRIEGRAAYLTEAAVPVFLAERRRIAASGRLTRERQHWLRLAAAAGAPAEKQARLASARLTEGVVVAARALYLTTVDRAFRLAKREHDWDAASRLRREKATVLYRVAGSPLPPPAESIDVFREGVAAELRGLAEISRDAELVSASCCDACRADDRLVSRISQELRVPRLPHEGCPRGLCRCHWDLAEGKRTTMRRYLRRRPRAESGAAPYESGPSA